MRELKLAAAIFAALSVSATVVACSGQSEGDGGDGQETPAPQVDQDRDGVHDLADNCLTRRNSSQSDADLDGIGDVCDLIYDQIIAAPPGHEYSNARTYHVGHFLSADDVAPPFSVDRTRDAVEGDGVGPGARQLVQSYSYGTATHTFNFIDQWMHLPRPHAIYEASSEGRRQQMADAMRILRGLGYTSPDDRFILVFQDKNPIPDEAGPCFASGFRDSYGSPWTIVLAGTSQAVCLDRSTLAHELLHTSGFDHAKAAACGGFVGGVPQNLLFPSGEETACAPGRERAEVLEYFSEDVMGMGIGHPSAPKKVRVGWMHPQSVVRVDRTADVELDPIEYATMGAKAAWIPLSDRPGYTELAYWAEYRAQGADEAALGSALPDHQVRVWASGAGATLGEGYPFALNDFTFKSADFPQGILLADGQAFHDPYRGVRITRLTTDRTGTVPRTTLQVERSDLRSYPRAVVSMRPGTQAIVEFVNEGSGSIVLETAHILGRGADKFEIAADGCSARTLGPTDRCAITVAARPDPELQLASHAVVQIESSDALRPLANHSIRAVSEYWTEPDPM